MHFHIKLILFLRKMKSQLLFMQKNVDYFQLCHKCHGLPGKGKDFHFFCCCYIELGELRPSCTFRRTQWKIRRNEISPNTIYQYRYSVNTMYNEHSKRIPLILIQLRILRFKNPSKAFLEPTSNCECRKSHHWVISNSHYSSSSYHVGLSGLGPFHFIFTCLLKRRTVFLSEVFLHFWSVDIFCF